jgi:hypothetical protein
MIRLRPEPGAIHLPVPPGVSSASRFRPEALLPLAFLLLVLTLSLQRFVLLSRVTAYRLAPPTLLLDAGVAVTVAIAALLLGRVHWAPAALFLAGVALLQVANNEMVIALDTVVSLADLGQGLDRHFLRGSLARLSVPGYAALAVGSVALCAVALARGRRRELGMPPARLLIPCLAAAVTGLFLLAPRTGGWEASNPLLLTLTRSLAAPVAPRTSPPTMEAAPDAPPPAAARPARTRGSPWYGRRRGRRGTFSWWCSRGSPGSTSGRCRRPPGCATRSSCPP